MLGLTSYQEALRALGPLLEPTPFVRILERPAWSCVEIDSARGPQQIGPAQLEEALVASHARRGRGTRAGGDVTDVLRSVGLALDELRASAVCLELNADTLSVRFADGAGRPHTLSYAGDELEALRRAAAARRHGQPLRRILILQPTPDSMPPLLEVLVAEFAVQVLAPLYARGVAAAELPPDLIIAQAIDGSVFNTIKTLRGGERTAAVPIIVLCSEGSVVAAEEAFVAGADDVLQEPVLPAQLRARIRTWLLRARLDPGQQARSSG